MKNVVIVVLLLSTLAGAYYWATKQTVSLEGVEGRTEKTTRGNLTIPITATGTIRPSRRVEIKAEASGEIIDILKRPGSRVKEGDLILLLQRDEEDRSVTRAKIELDTAKDRLAQAEIILQRTKTVDVKTAEAEVRQLDANVEFAKFQLEKTKALADANNEEILLRKTNYDRLLAQLDAAKAGVDRTKLEIPRFERDVNHTKAAVTTAENNLADAEKRLAKTEIIAPMSGVIADVPRQIGEVVQGAKTNLTGGTVLAVIVNVDRLILQAEVDEADIDRVRALAPEWAKPGVDGTVEVPADFVEASKGMEHLPSITVEAVRDRTFEGVIERIYPEPKMLQNVITYLVDIVIVSEERDALLSGMRAEVKFTSQHVSNVVLVPNEALREGPGDKLGVYVPKPGARPDERLTEFVPCTIGLDNGNYSEVREGLKEGQVVYTKLPAKQDEEKTKSKSKRKS